MGKGYGFTRSNYNASATEGDSPVKRAGAAYERLKRAVYKREICWLCGKPVQYDVGPRHPLAPSLDHRHPLNKGGDLLDPDNAELAHYGCNSARHDNPVSSARRPRSRDY